MKNLVLIIICFTVSSMSFGQIVPSDVTLPIKSIDMEKGHKRHITWHTSDNGYGFGHRIIDSNLGDMTVLIFQTRHNSTPFSNSMVITSKGFVGIGSFSPDELLTVKGTIHCQEVKVDLNVPADYVFEKYYLGVSELKPDYKMPSLAEIEVFIKENHHLPEMPSAKTIQEDGLQLKEMTNLLLQKVEELTLYTIEQEKRIKALEELLFEKE